MDRQALWDRLVAEYQQKAAKSKTHFERALKLQIRGGSHNIRLFEPFPFYDQHCSGSTVVDLDGNGYIDFWQGHYTNILGHNPGIIREILVREFQQGGGLQNGFPGSLQAELAAELCQRAGAEQVRFTTSGTLATLYAVMLSRAFTDRKLVLKVGGGWHGSQPYLLRGVTTYRKDLNVLESAGLHPSSVDEIALTRFDDAGDLEETFRRIGEQLACFILEPFVGEGGFLFVDQSYLEKARKLTRDYGVVLILDEIISGFRFCAGGISRLYGVQPDLAVFGKIIGGGMPLTALLGRSDILELCHPEIGEIRRVRAEGGTFSAHPASVLAGLTMIRHLAQHESDIYPKIHRLAEKARQEIPGIFQRVGVPCVCTGQTNGAIPGSSMLTVQFPLKGQSAIRSPEEVWNPEACDVELREKLLRLALVTRGFHVAHGFGSVCTAHTEADIDRLMNALEDVAKWIQ